LSIKYIKSVLWRGAKCLSYIEDTRCLKVNVPSDGFHLPVTHWAAAGTTRAMASLPNFKCVLEEVEHKEVACLKVWDCMEDISNTVQHSCRRSH